MRLFLTTLLFVSSAAHASGPECSAIFSPSSKLVRELVSLRLEADRAADPSTARALYSEFKTKFDEAQSLGLDLSFLNKQLRRGRAQKSSADSEAERSRERAAQRERYALNPWELTDSFNVKQPAHLASDVTPDGERVVYFDGSGNLKWRNINGTQHGDWLPLETELNFLSMSSDSRFALVSSKFRSRSGFPTFATQLVDLATQQPLFAFEKAVPRFSPDAKYFIAREDEGVAIFDLTNMSKKVVPLNHDTAVENLYFSKDSLRFAIQSQRGLEVVEVSTLNRKIVSSQNSINSLSRDFQMRLDQGRAGLVLTKADGSTKKIELPDGFYLVHSLFSPNGHHVVISGMQEFLVVETENGAITGRVKFDGAFERMDLTSDGRTLLLTSGVGDGNRKIHVYRWHEVEP